MKLQARNCIVVKEIAREMYKNGMADWPLAKMYAWMFNGNFFAGHFNARLIDFVFSPSGECYFRIEYLSPDE